MTVNGWDVVSHWSLNAINPNKVIEIGWSMKRRQYEIRVNGELVERFTNIKEINAFLEQQGDPQQGVSTTPTLHGKGVWVGKGR